MKQLCVFLTIIFGIFSNISSAISSTEISTNINNFFKNYPIIAILLTLVIILVSLHLIVHILVGLNKFSNRFGLISSLVIFGLFFTGIFMGMYMWIPLGIIGLISDIVIKPDKIINEKMKETEVTYYRDIPCNNDIFKIYYIAYQYGLSKKKSDFLGAIILKWIKEKRVTIADKNSVHQKGSIILNDEYNSLIWENMQEKQLYQMMYIASKNGILEKNELKKWCNNKFNKVHKWFKDVMSDEFSKLIACKELDVDMRTTKCTISEKLLEHAKQICGLKKFLMNFTLIHKRENIEVHLFEEYLIIAQILGIADKTIQQFEGIYPNIIKNVSLDFRDYMGENLGYIN